MKFYAPCLCSQIVLPGPFSDGISTRYVLVGAWHSWFRRPVGATGPDGQRRRREGEARLLSVHPARLPCQRCWHWLQRGGPQGQALHRSGGRAPTQRRVHRASKSCCTFAKSQRSVQTRLPKRTRPRQPPSASFGDAGQGPGQGPGRVRGGSFRFLRFTRFRQNCLNSCARLLSISGCCCLQRRLPRGTAG